MSIAELSLRALRFPTDALLPATTVVPLSADAIRERAPKIVTKPDTMNFRTMLPEPGGMYDYRLFGPGTVVDAPPVPLDEPFTPRKTQFARIPLAAPILHPLFAEHVRGEVAGLVGREAEAVARALTSLVLGRELATELAATEHGASLVMHELPVLPPDLRPLRMTEENLWSTSPLNESYRRVINRNQRLAKLIEQGGDPLVSDREYAELGDTVHCLFENDERPEPLRDNAGTPVPSLKSLCGGTSGLYRALQELDLRLASGDQAPLTGRLHLARMVMFALGFDVTAARPR